MIEKAHNTDYWVRIPDIPGCVADGETVEEALSYFQDALVAHLLAGGSANPARGVREVTVEGCFSAVYMCDISGERPVLRLVATGLPTK